MECIEDTVVIPRVYSMREAIRRVSCDSDETSELCIYSPASDDDKQYNLLKF